MTPVTWLTETIGGPRPGADAWLELLLAAGSLLSAGLMGFLALRRKEHAVPWTTGPRVFASFAIAFFSFTLLHGFQALGQPGWTPALKALATLASLGSALVLLWAVPRLLAVPTLEQIRLQGQRQLRDLETDLQAREQHHATQLEAQETQMQSQKLEALGILAGGLAHDFNNLLGAMAGNVELARQETGNAGPAQPYLKSLETLVSRASELVQQILAYSGRGQVQSVALDLNELVEQMTRLMSGSLARQLHLELQPGPDLPPVTGDRTQVQQVIMNLLLNASEAVNRDGGRISLRTGTEWIDQGRIDAHFSGQNLEPGCKVFLEVTDNGPGMSPEVLKRIFDPFYSTKFTGRGLGLPAVQGILRRHHGGIQVFCEPGDGTCFKVLFPPAPAGPAPAPAPAPTEALEQPLGDYRGSGTVLVVDDEDPLRAIAVKALERVGFLTLEARDGLEALQVFEAHQERIKLVLMDLTMPRMGGEEAYRVLRRSGILVPVLLSSGYTELDVLQHFHGRGIAGFLQKPYRLQTLLVQVRQALEAEPGGLGGNRPREPLVWTRELETGVPLLDSQHRRLLDAFNGLLESLRQAPESKQKRAFLTFKEITLRHFGEEDQLMSGCAYPRAREHQANHARLCAQIDHLAGQILAGQLTFTPPVMDFLEGWLIHHMQEEDRLLAAFLGKRDN